MGAFGFCDEDVTFSGSDGFSKRIRTASGSNHQPAQHMNAKS
jgi:hypothetical protein